MAEYPIIMKQKNSSGAYDTLYPQTLGSQVQGNIQSSQISGNIPSSQITGTFPASQITGLPTSLPANGGNADTLENQTVAQIIEAAVAQGIQIETGSYVGTGTFGRSNPNRIEFNGKPVLVVVVNPGFTAGNNTFWQTAIFSRNSQTSLYNNKSDNNWSGNVHTTSWGENYIEWYSTFGYSQQMNYANTDYGSITYQYWAILM